MPSPKTPQMILADFDEYFPKPNFVSDSDQLLADMLSAAHQKSYHDWLRSSMQSLLLHVMGEMPKAYGGSFIDKYAKGFNEGRNSCLAVIQSTIDSIKE